MGQFNHQKNVSELRTVTFKRHAHLFTLLSALWTAFTLLGIYLVEQARDPDYKIEVIAAMAIWGLHALFVALSVYFWMTEKETVLMVENDADSGEE